MLAWERIRAGDRLWDCHKYRMGNTTMRAMGSWPVDVKEINHEEGWALCSWNGNPPGKMYRYQLVRLRRSPVKGTE